MTNRQELRAAVWQPPRGEFLQLVVEIAESRGERLYLVGGAVRDALLGMEPVDIDLVVEGDGPGFAAVAGERLGVAVRASPEFLTADLEVPGVGRVDIATARSERYEKPGALPVVEAADLQGDLARRDFTVNTFALELIGPAEGDLRCVSGAEEDLENRLIKVLHERSFVDDPTRILRAVDLEARWGVRMDAETERAAVEAVESGALETVSGRRLWSEVERSLSHPERALHFVSRLGEIGVLRSLVPGTDWRDERVRLMAETLRICERLCTEAGNASALDVYPAAMLLVLCWQREDVDFRELAAALSLRRSHRGPLLNLPGAVLGACETLAEPDVAASVAHRSMRSLSTAELALLGALSGPSAERWALRELSELRLLELAITPSQLIDRGAHPGPDIGLALEQTRAARLDGLIDVEDELEYALSVLDASDRSDR